MREERSPPPRALMRVLAVVFLGFAVYSSWNDVRIDFGGGRAVAGRLLYRTRTRRRHSMGVYRYVADGAAYRIQGRLASEPAALVDYLPKDPQVARLRSDLGAHRLASAAFALFALGLFRLASAPRTKRDR